MAKEEVTLPAAHFVHQFPLQYYLFTFNKLTFGVYMFVFR